jgi:hypothetical protein
MGGHGVKGLQLFRVVLVVSFCEHDKEHCGSVM